MTDKSKSIEGDETAVDLGVYGMFASVVDDGTATYTGTCKVGKTLHFKRFEPGLASFSVKWSEHTRFLQ